MLVTRTLYFGLACFAPAALNEAAVVRRADEGERAGRETLRHDEFVALRFKQLELPLIAQREVDKKALLDLVGVRRRAVRIGASAALLVADDEAVVESVVAREAEVGVQLLAQLHKQRRHRLATMVKIVQLRPFVVRAATVGREEVVLGLGRL